MWSMYICICVYIDILLYTLWLAVEAFYKTCNTETRSCQLRKALSISVIVCNLYRLSVGQPL